MLKEEKGEAFLRSIPPGYRFKPRDDEIINFYLRPKIFGLPLPPNRIKEVFLYNYDPQTLTAMSNNALSNGVGNEYYFFTPRDRKYANGSRPARNAGNGYWKATGADKLICRKGKKIGLKKSLVFYQGKPPKGVKTNWLMHEYVLTDAPIRKRLGNEDMRVRSFKYYLIVYSYSNSSLIFLFFFQLDDWVLCRVYKNLREKRLKHETLQEGHQEEAQAEADSSAIVAYDGAQMVQQEGHQVESEAEADTSEILPYNGTQMVENGIAFAPLYEPINTSSQMLEHGIAFAPLYEPINTSSQMLENGIAFAPLYEPINPSSQMLENGIAFAPLYEPIDYGVFEPALFMQQHFSSDLDLDQFNQDPHTGLPPPF
ncbi:hypothetical protein ES319_A10G252800v1 [Gossypium barbadense]|uniref:NAC domain-containing protein n=2 Tax=Gossypium TaxID=3633 RepID=A0A5J5U8T6_GOSBA|nr:hypothetical protein ES319_A10G252800v1 [Gossypium barbadense]TYH00441.1 hypothetical protein ES288_A10G276800v1 [Gossypium darwinii]